MITTGRDSGLASWIKRKLFFVSEASLSFCQEINLSAIVSEQGCTSLIKSRGTLDDLQRDTGKIGNLGPFQFLEEQRQFENFHQKLICGMTFLLLPAVAVFQIQIVPFLELEGCISC